MPESRDTRVRFERWSKNPACEANTIAAVHGISMADVAKSEGEKPSMGQSPFALARGQSFEKTLFRNQAKRLREELARRGVLPAAEATFIDCRLSQNGGPYRTLNEARAATGEFFRELAKVPPELTLPVVAAGATVSVPGGVMLPEAILVLDVLIARKGSSGPELLVGEVKTYPDRGGYTDPSELATARAQAGVYIHGLRAVLGELGLESRISVLPRGLLVLSRPGFNLPSIRVDEDLEYQALRAERGFARLRKAAAALPLETLDVLVAVRNAATAYSETCISFCDRAPICHRKALVDGDPTILGDDAVRLLGEINVHRAVALLAGAKAKTLAEADLVRRLREADLTARV